jgi:tetratricopeptide (TPR) repeat protein
MSTREVRGAGVVSRGLVGLWLTVLSPVVGASGAEPLPAPAAVSPPPAAATPAPLLPANPTVLVLPFSSPPAEAWLARALGASLQARLVASDVARGVDPDELDEALAALPKAASHLDLATVRRLGRLLGVDLVVGGSVKGHAGAWTLRVELGLARGDKVRREIVSGEQVLELDARLAAAVAQALGAPACLAGGGPTQEPEALEALGKALAAVEQLAAQPRGLERTAAAKRQLAAVRGELARARSADPGNTLAWAIEALAAGLAADRSGVREALSASGGPQDARLALWLASAWDEAGELETAARTLADAVAVHPRTAALRARQGKVALERGRFAEAVDTLALYTTLAPQDALVLTWRSRALAALGRADEALVVAQRARDLAGDLVPVVRELAARWLEARRADDALALLAPALKAEPAAGRLRLLVARARLTRGEDVVAVNEGEKALKGIDDADREGRALAYLTLAHAWARLGQWDVALEQLAVGRRYGLTSLSELEGDPKLARFRADPRYPRAP